MDPLTATRAKHFVRQFTKHDPMVGSEGWYTVTSLYFDTPGLSDYYEKSGGFLERKKLRARIYEPFLNGSHNVWLEIKRKYDMAFQKGRVKLTRSEWQQLLEQNYTTLLQRNRPKEDKETLDEFIWYMLHEGRRPRYFVRYKRFAFLTGVDDSIRITFDEHIESHQQSTLSAPSYTTLLTDATVLEIKFGDEMPRWFGMMVRQLNLRRDSFSKYGRSIERLNHFNVLPR